MSEWTVNTMEQHRIQRRLLELGVAIETGHGLSGAGPAEARIACGYTARERTLPCDTLVLVTARLPQDELYADLVSRREDLAAAGIRTVRAIGDAWCPGTIAHAVWDGRRYAEELEGPDPGDAVPFRREVVQLSAAGSR